MATIKFYTQGNSEFVKIYVRLRDGRMIDAKAKTKFLIANSKWSSAKGRPKHLKDEELALIDQSLTALKAKILSAHNKDKDTILIDSNWLKEVLNPSNKSSIPNHLSSYIQFYAERKRNSLTKQSLKKAYVNQRIIERFDSYTGKKTRIDTLDRDYLERISNYCFEVEMYSQNTVSRFISFIKTICRDAYAYGFNPGRNIEGYSIKKKKIIPIYLSREEIDLIFNANLPKDYLDNARDWLLISCETAQRVSDFMRFTKSMISESKGLRYIEYKQQKTDKLHRIPITRRVESILKKRGGNFPRSISSVKYNLYIKEVCQIVGLTNKVKGTKRDGFTNRNKEGVYPKYKLVSAHIGRRSFATNNYGEMPTPLIIGMTGHSSEKQLLSYIGKSDVQTSEEIADYFIKTGKL